VLGFAFISTHPDLNTRQIETFLSVTDELKRLPEWRRWLSDPQVRACQRTWLIKDGGTRRFYRAKVGVTYHIPVADVVRADKADNLADWVSDQIYYWAEHVSKRLDVGPPQRR
jgi:hypothetical protein